MTNGKATTILASTLIGGLAVATLATPANASATYTWIQQVQRASADAPCEIPTIEGDAPGWSDWRPSWAQWPHDGQGGWVCTRSITWAQGSAPGSSTTGDSGDSGGSGASCITGYGGTNFWDFTGTDWLPIGTPVYSDAACTTQRIDGGGPVVSTQVTVLADSEEAADAICLANAPRPRAGLVGDGADPRLYYCNAG